MLKLELQYFGHLTADLLGKTLILGKTEDRRRRGRQRMRWLDGIVYSMDMILSKLRERVKYREVWHAAVHGVKKSQFSSVQFSHSVMSDSLQPHESQHARPPCPSPTPGVHSDSRPSSQ